MTVLKVEVVHGKETVRRLKPGTLLTLSGERDTLRGAFIADSNTAYYVQGGEFGLVAPVVGSGIDDYPSFERKLRWRKNAAGEPFERSNVDPTRLAFLPK